MVTVPNLASVLDQHQEAIAAAWLEAIDRQLPASHLCSIALERRYAAIKDLINRLSDSHHPAIPGPALVCCHTTDLGSCSLPVPRKRQGLLCDTALAAAASEMVRLGVGIDEAMEALLLGKDAVLPFIWQAYPPGSQAAYSAIGQFDAVLRRAARDFINAHAKAGRHLKRQRRQTEDMGVLLERARLAQEMHDDLAQAVGYLHAQASLTHELLSAGETDRAKASLLDMKKVAEDTYDEVTEAVFSLRTKLPGGNKFLPALREYLAQYGAYYGLDARLIIEDETLAHFSSAVASQVLFIIREALTNVRKHSGAGGATVRFAQDNGLVRITVEDHGHGFDLSRLPGSNRRRFGLQIMRERAESVEGSLAIDSQAGCGTRVIISVPQETG